MKPCIIGLMPDFFISRKSVFIPMAANADTIKNLLKDFMVLETVIGMKPRLLIIAIANINHGNNDVILTCLWHEVFSLDFLLFIRVLIREKTNTVGIIDNVRVSFTIVAKSPAASLKAYPAATTLDVSLTAVPVHNPSPSRNHIRKFPI